MGVEVVAGRVRRLRGMGLDISMGLARALLLRVPLLRLWESGGRGAIVIRLIIRGICRLRLLRRIRRGGGGDWHMELG